MLKRLLFVDDDPLVLAGLRRALHDMRLEWDMQFAPGALAALDALQKEPFDAVITDMRMPSMDGAQLLDRVKDRYPEVVRIILSGQSEKEAVLRSIAPAHQYLAKPCDIRELKARLHQAFASRDLVRNPSIAANIARLRSIPSLPAIYTELTNALRSEMTSLGQIEQIIAKDIGMATKILQLANSAFIGVHGRVSSLRQAVSLIGIETVRTLTLSIHVFSQFDRKSAVASHLPALWDHSVSVAAIAQRIAAAETGSKSLAEECFATGLLHDAGKIVLLAEKPKEYAEIISQTKNDPCSIESLEIAALGCSHAQLGAYLMSMWGLPASLVHAVAFHHCPSQAMETRFSPLTAVHCADALSLAPTPDDPAFPIPVDEIYLARLNLSGKMTEWRAFLEEFRLAQQ
ncbi:MAG TPA: response regulator [Acidobacteriaceae bacterium]|jgi:HD-like signal output (HDOD) protein